MFFKDLEWPASCTTGRAVWSPPVRTASSWRSLLKKLNSIICLIVILITAGALSAQTVSVSPTSLTFSALTGGAVQTQSLTVNNAGSPTFAVFSNATWLRIKTASDTGNGSPSLAGSTPATITVTADPTGLPSGVVQGGLTVVGNSGPSLTVPVTFTVSSIGVAPSPVTFAYQQNGILPNPATLTLTSSSTVSFTATGTTTSGGNWLVVPANGTSPGTFSVSVNSAVVGPGMPAGTYNGAINITPATGPAVSVPVTLTVTAAPVVSANPAAINLNYQSNGATGPTNTPSQTLTLTNPGAQDLAYLISPASAPGGWLLANPTNGTIPANGSIQVAISYVTSTNLPAGNYVGSLTIFIPGAAGQQLIVPVRLLISNSPLITVPGSTLAFTYQLNGSAPASKTVLVTSSAVAADAASGQLPLIITATTAAGGNWLIVPPNGQTGIPFSVAVNTTGLATGTYNGTVSVTGVGAANPAQTIPVTLTVSNDPLVVASFGGCSTTNTTCPLNFPIQIGQNNPTGQTIRVTSSTGAQASFTATVAMTPSAACGTGWLSSGVNVALVSNDASFPITVTPGAIVAGSVCTGTITISGTNPATGAPLPNSPVTIPVNMYVSSTAMLVPNSVALNFNTNINASASQTLTVTSTSATDQLAFNASTPGNAPWLLAGPVARNTAAGSNNIIVAVNSAGLAPGTYSSAVTLTATAAGVLDSPITVPVTLTVTAATMTVTPNSLPFSQTLGGPVPAPQKLTVTTNNSDITFNTSVNTVEAAGWLTATPASATATLAAPATVTVAVNGTGLAAGTYHGTVTLASTSPFTTGSPVSIAVTLEVKPGTLSATPTALAFGQVVGGPAPAAQTVSVAGAPGPLPYTVTTSTNGNTGNWITVTPAGGNTPSDIKVSVNAGALPAGDYTGKVTITSTGAAGSPLDIPVSLKVSTASTLVVAPATLTLSYVLGTSNQPAPQTVQLTATGAGVTFTTTTTTSAGGNWLTVTPSSGTAPATLTITTNTAGLAAGSYTGTIAINSPNSATQPAASITVNLTVTAVPKPVPTVVQNAASSLIGPVSPGENIVIYGSGIGPATLALGHVTAGLFDTTIANTRVLFDGVPAPIIYARADQTSVMVPYFVGRGPSTSVVIEYQGVQSSPITLSVTSTAPGIYALNQAGSGQGAILNQNLTVNAAANPAAKDSVIAVYMTGEGTTSPSGIDGGLAGVNGTPLAKPILPVTATVGGVPATVEYYGSAPLLIYGVMQVNVRIPLTAPSGPNVPIVITVGNVSTQTGGSQITVAVQ